MPANRLPLLTTFLLMLLASCNNAGTNKSSEPIMIDASVSSCKMKLLGNTGSLEANKTIILQLKPVTAPRDTTISLEILNQKKVQLVITNDDLSYFNHVYADKDSAGIYSINTSFPYGGDYVLIADYKAAGLQRQTDTFHITVKGPGLKKTSFNAPNMLANTDGYSLQLLSKKLVPGIKGMVIMKLLKDGKPVLPEALQPYLGEQAHMVAINTVTKEYVQVNSKSDPMSYWFMLNFPRAGLYRAWVEFMINNSVHTADFVIEVKAAG